MISHQRRTFSSFRMKGMTIGGSDFSPNYNIPGHFWNLQKFSFWYREFHTKSKAISNIIPQMHTPFLPQQHGLLIAYGNKRITNVRRPYFRRTFIGKINRPIRNGKRNLDSLGTDIQIPETPTATSNASWVRNLLLTDCNSSIPQIIFYVFKLNVYWFSNIRNHTL